MARTFLPGDLVTLPRIDYHGAIALASAVEAVATKEPSLPTNIAECVAQITSDRTTLQQAVAKAPGGALTVKEADRRIDKVGGAFHDIVEAWASLAEFTPQGQGAAILMERLFPEGRRFVNLKVAEEWAAIETKLATVEREALGNSIADIGASPILDLLKQMHTVYGAVVGTTEPLPEAPEVRESKDALMDSLREYVVQVVSTIKRNKPETATRADTLLKPLREWESTKAAKDKPASQTTGENGSPASPTPQ